MLNQAKDFENMLKDLGVEINYFFFVEIPEEETIRRLSNRLSCICGEVYNNLTNPPKTKGKCDKCGKDLFMREDDKPEIIKERLRLYHEKTALVKDYFKEKVKVIDGKGSIETVFNRILEILK